MLIAKGQCHPLHLAFMSLLTLHLCGCSSTQWHLWHWGSFPSSSSWCFRGWNSCGL